LAVQKHLPPRSRRYTKERHTPCASVSFDANEAPNSHHRGHRGAQGNQSFSCVRLFLRAGFAVFWRGQGELAGAADHVALLVGEHAFEARGIDDLIALFGGHCTQVADGGTDLTLAIRRKLAILSVELARLAFLLGSQVFPSLHAVEHPLLLLRRQVGEMLQALAQDLLLRRRKPPESLIVLQFVFLRGRRHIFVLAQPVASMPTLLRTGLCRPCNMLLRCSRVRLRRGPGRWRLMMLLPGTIPRETRMGEGCERGENRQAQQCRDVPRASHAAFRYCSLGH